jgi:hypothetical protein
MVQSYLQNSQAVILAVLPSNVDIATQEILKRAENAGPGGVCTIGVLTKPDLVTEVASQKVIKDLVWGKAKQLRLGSRSTCRSTLQRPLTSSHPINKPSTSPCTQATTRIPSSGRRASTSGPRAASASASRGSASWSSTTRAPAKAPRSSASSRQTAWRWKAARQSSRMLHASTIVATRMRVLRGTRRLARTRFTP